MMWSGCACTEPALVEAHGRYRVVWTADPTTQASLQWQQRALEGPHATVQLDKGDGSEPTELPVACDEVLGQRHCFARPTGLAPDAVVCATIRQPGTDGHAVERCFRTAPNVVQAFEFVAGGDTRENTDKPTLRRRANQLLSRLRPLFVLFGGDMVKTHCAGCYANWLDDWQLTSWVDDRQRTHLVPVLPTIGNHEAMVNFRNPGEFCRLFDLPCRYLSASLQVTVDYAMQLGGGLLSLVTLDSEFYNTTEPRDTDRLRAAQVGWLDGVLAQPAVWKIVQYHKPFRPHGSSFFKRPPYRGQAAAWSGLFYKHGVDLASESDSHLYKITRPIRPSKTHKSGFEEADDGTVFMGEGSWSAPARDCKGYDWTASCGKYYQFKWVRASAEQLVIRAIDLDRSPHTGGQISWDESFTGPSASGLERLNVQNKPARTELILRPRATAKP